MIPVAVVLLIVGVAFLAGSAAMQWIGVDPGTQQAPKYVWGEFRRFGLGTIELGLIALCLTIVVH